MSDQISRLTDAQYESVCSIGKNLHDRYLIDTTLPMVQVREWIEWLYHSAGRPKPKIVFALNPTRVPSFRHDPKIEAMTLGAVIDERGRYIGEKYAWKIREWMYRIVFDQRYSRLREVISRGQNLLASDQTSWKRRLDSASFYASFTLADRTAAWVAGAYGNIDPQFPGSDFYHKVTEFSQFGLFGLATGQKECWALRLPIQVITHPVQGVPHSDSAPAVVWKDGYEQFFLYGILFPWEIWQGVVTRSFKLKEIQRWSNMDRIRTALYYLGPQFLLKQCRAKLIHATENGNRLYSIEERVLTLNGIRILTYSCPSTGQEYHRFVPERLNDADRAQAWRFGLSRDEYLGLTES